MTQEEKARAYDEAIKKAAALYKASEPMSGCNVIIETLFPELKESEGESGDEKIRKAIIEGLREMKSNFHTISSIKIDDAIAWLEKQSEQIDIANKEYWRGYREGKKLILDKYAEVKKQCKQKFEMKTAEESLGVDSGTYNKIIDECIFGEQKTKENKGNIGGISPNWSEEDEQHVNSLLKRLQGMCKKGATYTATRFAVSQDIDWLKSIKERKGGKI